MKLHDLRHFAGSQLIAEVAAELTAIHAVEQVNLRVPVEIKEYLEKLATQQGSKLHPYVLKLLEEHVAT